MSLIPSVGFQLDLQPTLGAWLIGAIASVGLLGVLSLQSWTYFLRFPNDPNALKILVLTVWVMVFVKCAVSVHAGYFLAVVKWGEVGELLTPIWSMKAMLLLANFIVFLVHIFFAHKVWMLTRKRYWWIPTIILVFSLGQLGLGVATFYATLVNASYETIIFGQAGRLATANLGCSIIVDWTITTSLVIFLRAEKGSQSDIGLTKKFINTLIFYTINIGLLVSLADLVVLTLLNIKFKTLNLYQLMFYEVVGNLYANSLLACLNMRSAPSSLELSELAKSQHYSSTSYDRTLISQRLFGSRRLSTRHGFEPDRSVMEMDIGKGGPFPLTTSTVPEYKRTRTPSGWRSESVVKCPDIVVTKTTVTTVM